MSRLWKAGIVAAAAALGVPAAAQAAAPTTNITNWTSSTSGTPANSPYLISYDNQPTTLTVSGTGPAGDRLDIACYYGSLNPQSQYKVLATNLLVAANGTFTTGASAPQLRLIAGHACRLRAVLHGEESNDDSSTFAGPNVAVAEVALLPTISGGQNNGKPYNYYDNDVTLTGYAGWKAVGTPAASGSGACGGPFAAPIDQAFDIGNFPIDCAGSLLDDDLGIWGPRRSEVQIDGQNAYDAASAQALWPRTGGQDNGSQDLQGFPSVSDNVEWDPSSGLISSRAQESWVTCHASGAFPATAANCPSFDDTHVALTRVNTTSDGGRVITLTDTWSSTDGRSHSLDLLYDDYAGVFGNADNERGWEFPGQHGFMQYTSGASVAAPSSMPASILVRTNVTAADGDPNEGFGAITFGSTPSALRFASGSELEEHRLLTVPAGGSVSLSYVYSIGYSLADVSALAMAAQDRFEPAFVRITSPANGTTVTTPYVNLAGTVGAGSGIKSLVVGGQPVSVGSNGVWTSQVALSSGANTITALATDGTGATSQAQLTVIYQPPSASGPSPPPRLTGGKCKVPRVRGMKLPAAEKALRRAHCKIGKVRHVSSHKTGRGRVTSTTPRAGRKLRAGSKVDLIVSKGR